MARIPIDVTEAGSIPDGVHIATVNKVEYQVKTGEKWNKDGTTTCSPEEWVQYPEENRRFHITLHVPGKGNIWHDLYAKKEALGFVQAFLKACNVSYDKSGFDIEECLNKQVSITVATVEQAGFEPRAQITKVQKA